jgi:hypothetical protein
MAAQTGKFVSEERLYPRDDSGGSMGPKGCSDFADTTTVGNDKDPNKYKSSRKKE